MCVRTHWLFGLSNDRFTTADKVAGGKGFRAVWTEVKVPSLASGNNDCDDGLYFRCVNSSFCIAKQLECDGVLNCGVDDDSDEAHCKCIPRRSSWRSFFSFPFQFAFSFNLFFNFRNLLVHTHYYRSWLLFVSFFSISLSQLIFLLNRFL